MDSASQASRQSKQGQRWQGLKQRNGSDSSAYPLALTDEVVGSIEDNKGDRYSNELFNKAIQGQQCEGSTC